METATAARRHTCRLNLAIDSQPYSIRVLPMGDLAECYIRWELTKPRSGERYTVTLPMDNVPVCDCADFAYRREQLDPKGCKHIRSLWALGLLSVLWRGDPAEFLDDDALLSGGGAAVIDEPATGEPQPMPRAIAIEPDVAEILGRSRVDGCYLALPGTPGTPSALPRADYERADKVLRALGGRWQKTAGAHVFDRPVQDILAEALGSGSVVKNPDAYFPTPRPVIKRMLELAKLKKRRVGEPQRLYVLEPSAGEGALVDDLQSYDDDIEAIIAVEKDEYRASRILKQPMPVATSVVVGDFLAMDDEELLGWGRFHRVLMNPPFAVAGQPHAYFLHVMRAYELLDEGGRLVAVTPIGWRTTASSECGAFRSFVESFGGSEDLPADAFRESGTGVRACLVWLDRE